MNKLINLVAMLGLILTVVVVGIAYFYIEQFRASTYQSKAIIAQQQQYIIDAQRELELGKAFAFDVKVNSLVDNLLILVGYVAPYIFIIMLAVVMWIDKRKINERLQEINDSTE